MRTSCQYIQGYLTGKPMPAHAASAALMYTGLLPSELGARLRA